MIKVLQTSSEVLVEAARDSDRAEALGKARHPPIPARPLSSLFPSSCSSVPQTAASCTTRAPRVQCATCSAIPNPSAHIKRHKKRYGVGPAPTPTSKLRVLA